MARSASIGLEGISPVSVKGAIRDSLHYQLRAYRKLPLFVDREDVDKEEKEFLELFD